MGLNPLFGGSAFRTVLTAAYHKRRGLNPLFGGSAFRTPSLPTSCWCTVLIPFLAGLLFGQDKQWNTSTPCLNPLFGGSAFRTADH